MLLRPRSGLFCAKSFAGTLSHGYATVRPITLVGRPPASPRTPVQAAPSALDALILSELRRTSSRTLPHLLLQYTQNERNVLEASLPYESRPGSDRMVRMDGNTKGKDDRDGVVMVAHAIQRRDQHKVVLCSGFHVDVPALTSVEEDTERRSMFVTCAHTMEEIQDHPLLSTPSFSTYKTIQGLTQDDLVISGTLVLSGLPDDHVPAFSPVTSVPSSLHRADLLLLSTLKSSLSTLRTLPVSPYPVQAGTPVRAHFVVHQEPEEELEGWRPWVGGTWSKWVKGTVLGYRDMAGREAKPGTYDSLSHLLFKPIPTSGSSGGPIVDEETGAIVGVIVGTRMDSQLRGWGRPAETIFEMFNLPGLNLNSR